MRKTDRAYYNEWEPYTAQWLRNLIAAGLIPAGDVDERSIADVDPTDLDGFTQCHFFAGIGGWPYALRLAGWPDDRPVWTASLPCQPFSVAGKAHGMGDERHLWPAFRGLVEVGRPPVCFGEQVASADGRAWLAGVRADLEGLGYVIGAADLCAAGVGAPHIRQRLYWVAFANGAGRDWSPQSDQFPARGFTASRWNHVDGRRSPAWTAARAVEGADGSRRLLAPGIECMADELSPVMERLRAYGNAIVPQVAAEFIGAYMDCAP